MSDEVRMSKAELKECIRQAVKDTLVSLGIEHDDPFEMQRDYQFLRELRKTSEAVKRRGILVLVGLVVIAAASALWIGIKAALSS